MNHKTDCVYRIVSTWRVVWDDLLKDLAAKCWLRTRRKRARVGRRVVGGGR
jgi:hypothetical protein